MCRTIMQTLLGQHGSSFWQPSSGLMKLQLSNTNFISVYTVEMAAETLYHKAESKLKGFVTYFTGPNYEDANDLFLKAASMNKAAGEWQQAGLCFKRAAQCCKHLHFDYEASSSFCEAASAYHKAQLSDEAVACWTDAIQIYIETNRFHQAGKVEDEIGEMYMGLSEHANALSHFQQSIRFYSADTKVSNIAGRIRKKIAMVHVHSGCFAEASHEFSIMAKDERIRTLTKDYYFCSILCDLALLRKENLSECVASVRERMRNIFSCDLSMSNTREFEMVDQVCSGIEMMSTDEIKVAMRTFTEIKRLDDWMISILYGIQMVIESDDER